MAYIGKTPVLGNFVKLDAISVVNGQAAYTMQNGGVNFTSYDNVNQFLVSLNGILQSPTDSFTVSGSTLTFASNLSTGDVIDFVMVLGNTLDVGTPSDNTVTTAKLADSSVSLAKLTATGTKSSSTFLRGDNTFDTPPLGGITVADQFRMTANNASNADITSNIERVDTSGQGGMTDNQMSESSGIFTFPLTGIYLVKFNVALANDSGGMTFRIMVTTNNSSYTEVSMTGLGHGADQEANGEVNTLVDVTNTSNVKVKFNFNNFTGSGTTARGDTNVNKTYFTFIRLGDT